MLALFPEILHMVSTGDLETLACLVRKYFGDQQIYSPRLRVEPLLINAGLELSRDDTGVAARLFAADHRGAWHASVILSPNLRDAGEVNFTLAHLFGHFLCEIQPLMAKGELRSRECLEHAGALGRYLKKPLSAPEEAQADAFANALLMPRGMVKKAYATLGTVADTAAFFNVRQELMEQRLAQLDLLAKPVQVVEQPVPAPVAKPQQNSLMRAQKSATASLYRREEGGAPKTNATAAKPVNTQSVAAQPTSGADSQLPSPKASDGLRRLREIARKIDKSVDS